MDDNVLTRIGDALGAVAQADLHLNRTGRRRLQALVDAGELKRYPHGIVALPGTDRRILIARLTEVLSPASMQPPTTAFRSPLHRGVSMF